jgi:transcriptional regulator with PAS, ATPase and Fis domain
MFQLRLLPVQQGVLVDNEPEQELKNLRSKLENTVSLGGLIGTSPVMRSIHGLIEIAVAHAFPVVILGETGTGKELVARCIHCSGPRKNSPFIPVDCSSLTPTLIESELFGYVRGAFTGAARDRKGLFEAAHTGTLFLDEIGELPKELQAKLLRVIQEHAVRRVGSTQAKPVDARIIVATNRNLKQAAQDGRFREDLYYRLNVFNVTMPPLRDRKVDIPMLVTAFLAKHADPTRQITSIGPSLWAAAMSYDWPGNVRELENFIERCIALGSGPILEDEDRCVILNQTGENLIRDHAKRLSIKNDCIEPLHVMEQRMICQVMANTSGDMRQAARILGIGRTTLYRKLKEYRFDVRSQTPIASVIS